MWRNNACTCPEFCVFHTPVPQRKQDTDGALRFAQSPDFERLLKDAVERSKEDRK